MESNTGHMLIGPSSDTSLVRLNDEGKTFNEIADIIEANWRIL